MVLSKRESKLAWGVGIIAMLLATDLLIIEPYFAQRAKLSRSAASSPPPLPYLIPTA